MAKINIEHRLFFWLLDRWATKKRKVDYSHIKGKWISTLCLTKHYKITISKVES